ncbi:glucosidase II beta subunit-like-domain-containing protein [Peziza echinospora]|nr:glucosidase II beta subunit-like-domain-containing protein [Peziza echinospora]
MHHHQLLALLSAMGGALASKAAAGSGLPRGVSPEDAALYLPTPDTHTFTCLTHPSLKIPFTAVNDDYCDCPDGSDEPGTSACTYLPHAQLTGSRGFYCANKAHAPRFLPANRVNDGVCDYEVCCDGSDEWAHVGGVQCPDRCGEVGEKVRRLLGETRRVRNEGARLRGELVAKATSMRREVEANCEQLRSVIVGLEEKLRAAEAEARDVEAREMERVRRELAAGGGRNKKAAEVAEVARGRIEALRKAVGKVRAERDESRARLEEVEGILRAFKETYNPNFNDEGVKSTVRRWEDYVAAGRGLAGLNEAEERDLEALVGGEDEVNWDELTAEEVQDEVAQLSLLEKYLPKAIQGWIHTTTSDLRQMLVENGILAEKTVHSHPTDSKAVTEAKSTVAQIDTDLTSARNRLASALETLSTDYGPSSVLLPLKDTCVSADAGEYTYEFCFFGKAHQRSNKDASSSSFLGEHRRIEIESTSPSNNTSQNTPDAEEGIFPAGELEQQHAERTSGVTIFHEGGARCWNGPERSARVELYCAVVNELRLVKEVEKCVYLFEVGTPAVCEGEVGAEERVRDEL